MKKLDAKEGLDKIFNAGAVENSCWEDTGANMNPFLGFYVVWSES